eukprot:CAMPEP_0170198384 /NCGR_PEP_ID=MMETSP0040_2-20121228/68713_1 /TAXON_ID=641309 /ORGANISM="Lotharella oceanica, Strain CCMP622" /LENGTH=93 /DNA_ID=CAMNT_0010448327 /DNA_START=209 /DNA_END=486 /DNA_ORIENTATION=-
MRMRGGGVGVPRWRTRAGITTVSSRGGTMVSAAKPRRTTSARAESLSMSIDSSGSSKATRLLWVASSSSTTTSSISTTISASSSIPSSSSSSS